MNFTLPNSLPVQNSLIDQTRHQGVGNIKQQKLYERESPIKNKYPQSQHTFSKYKKKYGDLGPYSIYAYVAVNILLDAAKDAAATDSKALMDKIRSKEFQTALGKIRFSEKGDVSEAPYIVWITKNGKFEEFWKP